MENFCLIFFLILENFKNNNVYFFLIFTYFLFNYFFQNKGVKKMSYNIYGNGIFTSETDTYKKPEEFATSYSTNYYEKANSNLQKNAEIDNQKQQQTQQTTTQSVAVDNVVYNNDTYFLEAFENMIKAEGGYVLHKVSGDSGGWTYAGIARNANPNWAGWNIIDKGCEPDAQLVRDFYKKNYWDTANLSRLKHRKIALSIFDFGVNAGVKTSCVLAQTCVGVTPDGKIGEKSIAALNNVEPTYFSLVFALAKIKRYNEIVGKRPVNLKFLRGWINRTFTELERA